jgi:hypothetical protein
MKSKIELGIQSYLSNKASSWMHCHFPVMDTTWGHVIVFLAYLGCRKDFWGN